MNLGDKTLVTHVVKHKNVNGLSTPFVEELPSPVEGIVVAETWACSGGNGHPPKQEFRVYEVAVTLSKHLKTPVNVPAKPTIVVQPTPITPSRNPVSALELFDWTEIALNEKIASGQDFTAHDITQSVRASHPHMDVPHVTVRDLVHGLVSNRYDVVVNGQHPSGATLFSPA